MKFDGVEEGSRVLYRRRYIDALEFFEHDADSDI